MVSPNVPLPMTIPWPSQKKIIELDRINSSLASFYPPPPPPSHLSTPLQKPLMRHGKNFPHYTLVGHILEPCNSIKKLPWFNEVIGPLGVSSRGQRLCQQDCSDRPPHLQWRPHPVCAQQVKSQVSRDRNSYLGKRKSTCLWRALWFAHWPRELSIANGSYCSTIGYNGGQNGTKYEFILPNPIIFF